MRTLSEIGLILLSNKDLYKTGLCRWLLSCYNEGLISEDEWEQVYQLLCVSDVTTGMGYCLGGEGDIEGRIEWINNNLID